MSNFEKEEKRNLQYFAGNEKFGFYLIANSKGRNFGFGITEDNDGFIKGARDRSITGVLFDDDFVTLSIGEITSVADNDKGIGPEVALIEGGKIYASGVNQIIQFLGKVARFPADNGKLERAIVATRNEVGRRFREVICETPSDKVMKELKQITLFKKQPAHNFVCNPGGDYSQAFAVKVEGVNGAPASLVEKYVRNFISDDGKVQAIPIIGDWGIRTIDEHPHYVIPEPKLVNPKDD